MLFIHSSFHFSEKKMQSYVKINESRVTLVKVISMLISVALSKPGLLAPLLGHVPIF